ncbi:MAG: class I SAM-dependent methyltransferase [Actinomycetota bacterium]
MPDELFANPRLAVLYDRFDHDRSDLDVYAAMIASFAAHSILDVGCGTGSLAVRLAAAGLTVVGVDPAEASLNVARTKPHADDVRWILGDATDLPPLAVDVAVMCGNVAQVFVDDGDWAATLDGVRAAVAPTGRFVFETRDPARRAWERWRPDETRVTIDIPSIGAVTSWHELRSVDLPLVTFDTTYRFHDEGTELLSRSTLRFRERDELTADLATAGFTVDEVRDAPDRPGLEWVFIARPTDR